MLGHTLIDLVSSEFLMMSSRMMSWTCDSELGMHVLLELSRTIIISNLLMEECVKFALGDTFVGCCLCWFIDSDHNRLIVSQDNLLSQ